MKLFWVKLHSIENDGGALVAAGNHEQARRLVLESYATACGGTYLTFDEVGAITEMNLPAVPGVLAAV